MGITPWQTIGSVHNQLIDILECGEFDSHQISELSRIVFILKDLLEERPK